MIFHQYNHFMDLEKSLIGANTLLDLQLNLSDALKIMQGCATGDNGQLFTKDANFGRFQLLTVSLVLKILLTGALKLPFPF